MIKKLSFIIIGVLTLSLVLIYYKYNISTYFSFESLKYNKQLISYWFQNYKWQFIIIFIISYSLSCFFIIPLLYLILNIVAGFIFGIIVGLVLVSIVNFYTTVLTFLAARFMFRSIIEKRFNKLLLKVNKQLNNNGILYVFFIRAFPITPFVISNAVMGLTRINLWIYVIIGQLSILPELLLTLYVGKKLDSINNMQEIMNTQNYLILCCIVFIFIIAYIILNKKVNKKDINDKTLLL